MGTKPLILVTNDDGIGSPGLHAAAQAVVDLGDLLIMAPSSQRTGSGRSYPPVSDKHIYPTEIPINDQLHPAFKSDVSPAQAVVLAQLVLAERPIDLCVSGINFGENVGSTVTTSGTVGAAIEAASFDIPALAVSLETPSEFHVKYSERINFDVAAHFTRYFARQVLSKGLPQNVDLLKIDVPATATPHTPWRVAAVSRQRYWHPVENQPGRPNEPKSIGYQARVDYDSLEPESDISIFLINRLVSVAPMTIDLTAPVKLPEISAYFNGTSS